MNCEPGKKVRKTLYSLVVFYPLSLDPYQGAGEKAKVSGKMGS